MSTLDDLIARLEGANNGAADLDAEICRVLDIQWSSDEDGNWGGYGIMPLRVRFTRSLDAALTLVPEGWSWHAWDNRYLLHPDKQNTFGASVEIAAKKNWVDGKSSAPIALCIAALKAGRSSTPSSARTRDE